VPPQLARMDAEDLIGATFPDQIACAENLVGEREIPDHPLVRQTITDCLTEAMDIDGLEALLARIEQGEVRIVALDLTEPSPLALEVLSARPYAYLDDAPLEERRTQAVMNRRWLAPEDAAELGRLDPEAIARVQQEAWPDAANADELHDALLWLGVLSEAEAEAGGRREWLPAARRAPPPRPLPSAARGVPGGAAGAGAGSVARRAPRSGYRGAGVSCRESLVARGGAGRAGARAPGRAGSGDARRACGFVWIAGRRHRGGARGAGSRRFCFPRA